MSLRRTVAASIAALSIVLASAGAALAATSSSTGMTLTVGQSCSISALPSSIDFGSSLGNETRAAPAFNLTVASNGAATFTEAVTNLTATGGSIPKANIKSAYDGGAASAADGKTFASWATTGSVTKSVVLSVDVPADQAAGAYTGTYTVSGTC